WGSSSGARTSRSAFTTYEFFGARWSSRSFAPGSPRTSSQPARLPIDATTRHPSAPAGVARHAPEVSAPATSVILTVRKEPPYAEIHPYRRPRGDHDLPPRARVARAAVPGERSARRRDVDDAALPDARQSHLGDAAPHGEGAHRHRLGERRL